MFALPQFEEGTRILQRVDLLASNIDTNDVPVITCQAEVRAQSNRSSAGRPWRGRSVQGGGCDPATRAGQRWDALYRCTGISTAHLLWCRRQKCRRLTLRGRNPRELRRVGGSHATHCRRHSTAHYIRHRSAPAHSRARTGGGRVNDDSVKVFVGRKVSDLIVNAECFSSAKGGL